MSETKHTPGPWSVGESDHRTVWTEKGGMKIADCAAGWCFGSTSANARLIAAAPELLEACRMLDSIPEANFSGSVIGAAIRAAHDAVAKAEGGGT